MITSNESPAKYKLKFLPEALKEWHQLDGSIKLIFRKALKKRLIQPKVPGSELHGDLKDCYKIKLRSAGYRFVYRVDDEVVYVTVIAVGKREKSRVYESAQERIL